MKILCFVASRLSILALVFAVLSVPEVLGQSQSGAVPDWLQVHMTYMTKNGGRWIASNAEFENEKEPFDQYGTEWKWGAGKKTISGRLFALKDKKEVATFWEFRLFWHPTKRKAVLQQFGGNGVVGIGEMRSIESGGDTERMTEMTFHNIDGTKWIDMHKIYEKEDEHQTTSFKLINGSWLRQRSYIWRRVI